MDGSSSVLRVSVVTVTTDLPARNSPEDKVSKNPLKHQGGQKVQTPSFPNHIEYTYSTTSEKMPAEFGEEKTSTAIKTTESILLFTQEVGIQQDNDEREENVKRERRGETERGKERENKRTASLVLPNDGQILQNILLTIFTKILGSGQICVRNSQQTSCALNCGGLNSECFFFVCFLFSFFFFWFLCRRN